MKKVLLASAALLALSTAAQAAEPVKLSIGGYATQMMGYAGNDNATIFTSGETASTAVDHKVRFDTQDDVNINFLGSTKLDNGITVGVEVDTFGSQRKDSRANAAGNLNTKRSFITVGTVAGTLIVGEREDALYIVHSAAPDVGTVGLQDGYWHQFVATPYYHKLMNTTSTSRYDDRSNKISYVSPSWNGLAAAASYVPAIGESNSGATTVPSSYEYNGVDLTTMHGSASGVNFGGGDLYGAGLAFANTFGDVSIKADTGVGRANIAGLTVYQGGTQVAYAGFTLGGSILNRHVESDASLAPVAQVNSGTGALTQATAYAGQSWDLGLAYATGPYSVSLGYFHDTTKKAETTAGHTDNGYAADSTDVIMLGGKYVMGPGVALTASVGQVDYKTASTNIGDKNKGVLAVTGIRVDF